MPSHETILSVFVASPSDVGEERSILEVVVKELNLTWSKNLGIRLELIKWETHAYPGIGTDAQSVINSEIRNDFDIFIGILWTRFGTPTGRDQSGTSEEFERAYDRFRQDERDLRIMFYFRESPPPTLEDIDPDQLKLIRKFRTRLGEKGFLHWSYNSCDEFENFVRMHLSRQVQDWGKTWGNQTKALVSGREVSPIEPSGTIAAEVEEVEEGLLDLIEIGEERFQTLAEVTSRMTAAMVRIGEKMGQNAQQITQQSHAAPLNPKQLKRLVNRGAEDVEEFARLMDAEIPIFSETSSRALKTFAAAAGLVTDFKPADKKDVKDALEQIKSLKAAYQGAIAGNNTLRVTIDSWPRITTAINRAKRHTHSVLDNLERELTNTVNAVSEVEKMLEHLLNADEMP